MYGYSPDMSTKFQGAGCEGDEHGRITMLGNVDSRGSLRSAARHTFLLQKGTALL
jgi:hypothetical protein